MHPLSCNKSLADCSKVEIDSRWEHARSARYAPPTGDELREMQEGVSACLSQAWFGGDRPSLPFSAEQPLGLPAHVKRDLYSMSELYDLIDELPVIGRLHNKRKRRRGK